MTLKKRRIIFLFCGIFFLVLAPILLFYSLGYRLDKNFRIGRTGGLYVSSPVSGSEIFVKNKQEKKTNILQNGLFLQNLKTGIYPILITKDGYWPWLKNLEIKEGLVTETRAILVSKNPAGEMILKGNFSAIWASPNDNILLLEENKAGGVYATFYLPDTKTFLTSASSETAKLLSFKSGISKTFWGNETILLKGEKNVIRAAFDFSRQTVKASLEPIDDFSIDHKKEKLTLRKKERLWQDDKVNAIWLEWLADKESIPYYLCDIKPCENTSYLISNFRFPIKNADFFPGRRDVVLAATYNSVFTLEIDNRGGRLSFPIYKGKEPTFAVFPNEQKVYIIDDGAFFVVSLEEK